MDNNIINQFREKIIKELSTLDEDTIAELNFDHLVLEALIFDDNNNHKIFGLPRKTLERIDFRKIPFDNFNAEGFDFTGLHNVHLSASELYDNSLKFTTLNGVTIHNLKNAKLYQTDFTNATTLFILNWKYLYRREEICKNVEKSEEESNNNIKYYYIDMSYCKFSNVHFAGFGDDGEIKIVKLNDNEYLIPLLEGTDFTNSSEVIIDPEGLNLKNAILADAKFYGSFKNSSISGAKFSKTHSYQGSSRGYHYCDKVFINPQEIQNNDLTNCDFNNVIFEGPLDNCLIEGSNFTGSQEAEVNLATIKDPDKINSVNFTDATVIGKDGKEMYVAKDGKINTTTEERIAQITDIKKYIKIKSKDKRY